MTLSVLYLGPASGTSLHRREAFKRLGHRVVTIEPRKLLPRTAWIDRIEWHFKPQLLTALVGHGLLAQLRDQHFDLAFVDGGSLISSATLRDLRRHCGRIVNFNHDDPFGPRDFRRFSVYREAVPEYDLVTVVRQLNAEEARVLGARRVLRASMVADEVAHRPRPITPDIRARWSSDVAFIGTWMPERGPFLRELIRAGVPLAIYGSNWHKAPEWKDLQACFRTGHLDGDDYPHAVQCAKVSLGLLSKGNRDLHTTRSLEIPSLGGLLCAERTEEHTDWYREGEEAAFWRDARECAEACHALLADDPRRERMAQAGRERFLRDGRSSENLLKAMLREVALG